MPDFSFPLPLRRMFLAIALIVSASVFASAQFDTGTIIGVVSDQSGAAVANATVTMTNTGTSFQKTATTDSAGNFTVPALLSGNYVVSAKASKFNEARSQPIMLNVGATVRVNLALSVQAIQETVVVTGTGTTVDTNSSTAGTTLYAQQIENLPTNGRDVMDFLEIAPGSVNSIGFFQGSVNGQENFFTGLNVTVDGSNANRGDVNGFDSTEGSEAVPPTAWQCRQRSRN